MTWIAPIFVAGVAALAAAAGGCGGNAESMDVHEAVETPPCSEESGEREIAPVDLEKVMSARCEHGELTYRCGECRYEVGVVRIDTSLVSGADTGASAVIRIARVTTRRTETVIRATGEISMNENATVHVSPRVPGIIRQVNVDMGSEVPRGAVLLEIESMELGEALGQYRMGRTLAALSAKTYERERSLYEQKIGSEQEMIEARITLEQHEAELAMAEQKLHVLGFSDGDIEMIGRGEGGLPRGTLPIRASIAGTVVSKHASTGELAEPGNDLVVLSDLSAVWVWIDVYERDLAALIEGKKAGVLPVEVRVRAFPDRVFSGEVSRIGATMDEATRTVKARVVVANRDRLLRPGMFCEARIALGGGGQSLAVPRAALLADEGVEFVFKHMTEGYYVRQDVRTGRDLGDEAEILAGLSAGETIVIGGAFLLKSDVLREKMGAGCAD